MVILWCSVMSGAEYFFIRLRPSCARTALLYQVAGDEMVLSLIQKQRLFGLHPSWEWGHLGWIDMYPEEWHELLLLTGVPFFLGKGPFSGWH